MNKLLVLLLSALFCFPGFSMQKQQIQQVSPEAKLEMQKRKKTISDINEKYGRDLGDFFTLNAGKDYKRYKEESGSIKLRSHYEYQSLDELLSKHNKTIHEVRRDLKKYFNYERRLIYYIVVDGISFLDEYYSEVAKARVGENMHEYMHKLDSLHAFLIHKKNFGQIGSSSAQFNYNTINLDSSSRSDGIQRATSYNKRMEDLVFKYDQREDLYAKLAIKITKGESELQIYQPSLPALAQVDSYMADENIDRAEFVSRASIVMAKTGTPYIHRILSELTKDNY